MELSKTENRSAFAQAIDRRDGAMREMLGMGSDPVGYAERDKRGVWLFLLSSLARRNGLLSFRSRQRR
jgi:hypothetical protein